MVQGLGLRALDGGETSGKGSVYRETPAHYSIQVILSMDEILHHVSP